MQPTVCVPQCPCLDHKTPCGVRRQEAEHSAGGGLEKKRETESGAATHRSSRSSLVALVPSTDQTAHCTVLHWPSVFFCPCSVHKHWHTHSGGAGLRRSHEMSTGAWVRVYTLRQYLLVSLRVFAVIVVVVVVLPY